MCTPHPPLAFGTISRPSPPRGGNARKSPTPLPSKNISHMACGAGLMLGNSVFSGQSPAGNALIGGRVTLRPGALPRRLTLAAPSFHSGGLGERWPRRCEDAHPTLVGKTPSTLGCALGHAGSGPHPCDAPSIQRALSNGARACLFPDRLFAVPGSLVPVNKECRGKRWKESLLTPGERGFAQLSQSFGFFFSFLAFCHLDII